MEIDTSNRFLVMAAGDHLRIMFTPSGLIDRADALCLAAWLVAIADPTRERFDRLLRAVLEA